MFCSVPNIASKSNLSQVVSKEKKSQYFISNKQFLEIKGLYNTTKNVLQKIHFYNTGPKGCIVSDTRLCQDVGITKRALQYQLKKLRGLGLIRTIVNDGIIRRMEIDYEELASNFLRTPYVKIYAQNNNKNTYQEKTGKAIKPPGSSPPLMKNARSTRTTVPSFNKKKREATKATEQDFKRWQEQYPKLNVLKVYTKMLKKFIDRGIVCYNEVKVMDSWLPKEWPEKETILQDKCKENAIFASKVQKAYNSRLTVGFKIYDTYIELPNNKALAFADYSPDAFKEKLKWYIDGLGLPVRSSAPPAS